MENLIAYINSRITLTPADFKGLQYFFEMDEVSANTKLLQEGMVERYVYFLSTGVVKGYENMDGKIVVQHLVSEGEFFTSLDSFMTKSPAPDYYETITDCKLIKISRDNFDILKEQSNFFGKLVETITNEHLSCKLDRVRDFQVLSAKERYLKFLEQHSNLVAVVSVENIASFLGMEPQSLSRIRKQLTF